MPQLPKRLVVGMVGRSAASAKREAVAMSAFPPSTGWMSFRISAGSNWPSESMLTAMSTWRRTASARHVWRAAPTPRLTPCDSTEAPAPRASAAVSSVEPSSTTRTSTAAMPGTLRGMRAMTSAMVADSLSAGSITRRRFGGFAPSVMAFSSLPTLERQSRSSGLLAPVKRHRKRKRERGGRSGERDPEPGRAQLLGRRNADAEGDDPRNVHEFDRGVLARQEPGCRLPVHEQRPPQPEGRRHDQRGVEQHAAP